jgi:hypothetical protein
VERAFRAASRAEVVVLRRRGKARSDAMSKTL